MRSAASPLCRILFCSTLRLVVLLDHCCLILTTVWALVFNVGLFSAGEYWLYLSNGEKFWLFYASGTNCLKTNFCSYFSR